MSALDRLAAALASPEGWADRAVVRRDDLGAVLAVVAAAQRLSDTRELAVLLSPGSPVVVEAITTMVLSQVYVEQAVAALTADDGGTD